MGREQIGKNAKMFLDPLHVKEKPMVPDFVAGKSFYLYFYEIFV